MIISLRLKNFYSLRDDSVIDFTADPSLRNSLTKLSDNIIEFSGDKFVNIIGLFGSNAAGKSNIIKAVDFCRSLILNSHLNNEGDDINVVPFKFGQESPSEFYINFVTQNIEFEYSFELFQGKVRSESLYYYPKKRRAKIFSREKVFSYSHRKGTILRPSEVEANTGSRTLFISRASSMNRPLAQMVYRFFLEEMIVGPGRFEIGKIRPDDLISNKKILLKALEVSDSDIVDFSVIEPAPGQYRLQCFHKENPAIAFDFESEESEGTKRLLFIVLLLLKASERRATVFFDEFDLKLHLRLSEFLLDLVRASRGAQLVFTSHNPVLIDREKLRPEQIIFVTKHSDGNSEFAPLSDFRGISPKSDIQKAYLQGRFDAVPYVGNSYSLMKDFLKRS